MEGKVGKKKKFASEESIWATIRKRLDLTQVQMANRIKCTQPWLWRIEAEKSVPSILFVAKACEELDVDIQEVSRYYRDRECHFKRPLS